MTVGERPLLSDEDEAPNAPPAAPQSTPIMTTAVAPKSTKAVPPAKFSQNIEFNMIAPDIPERENASWAN